MLPNNKSINEYILAIHSGEEWADNLEIATLMLIYNRPIIVIDSDKKIRNGSDIAQFSEESEPIFVFYNGHNHYDALLLDNRDAREILEELISSQSNKISMNL